MIATVGSCSKTQRATLLVCNLQIVKRHSNPIPLRQTSWLGFSASKALIQFNIQSRCVAKHTLRSTGTLDVYEAGGNCLFQLAWLLILSKIELVSYCFKNICINYSSKRKSILCVSTKQGNRRLIRHLWRTPEMKLAVCLRNENVLHRCTATGTDIS